MTQFTHTVVTTAGIALLRLNGIDVFWAFVFGVLLDLDHLIKIPIYRHIPKWWKVHGLNWRTPLQEPVSLLWVVPLSLWLNTLVPVIFFILHLLLDYSVNYIKKPFFPYSKISTRGFFPQISNLWKEVSVFLISAVIAGNAFL